jgi:hypothetical protein
MASSKAIGVWTFLAVAAVAAAASYYGMGYVRSRIAPTVDTSLRAVLPAAEWATVYRKSGKVEIPVATIGPASDENPEMLSLLVNAARYGVPAPQAAPDLFLNVRFSPKGGGEGRMAHYGYVTRDGALGRADDWAKVPSALRRWLAGVAAEHPEKEYTIVDTPGGKVAAPVLPELKDAGQ